MRLPYEWRKKEGCRALIPFTGRLQYKWDTFAENRFIRHAALPACGVNRAPRKEKIVLSLTTFPARIEQCFFTIKSLMLQTVPADRIVLWLAEEQFPDHTLPKQYEELTARGLEIRYCDDLRSHKKYYYMLDEQSPDELVATYDDDIIYEADSVEKLLAAHQTYPNAVICNRGMEMTAENGHLLPYAKWKVCSEEGVQTPSLRIMPSTGNGCLYPYGIMPPSTFDLAAIRENAFSADDIWMKFNSLSAGVPVVRTRRRIAALVNVTGSQKESLTVLNNGQNENDRTVARLLGIFPDTEKLLFGQITE